MNKSNFERELELHGVIIYPNTGTSMLPLLRQGKDLMVIRRRPAEKLKKYDAVLYKRNGNYIMHRILKIRDDGYVICGDNRFRREFGVAEDQVIGVLSAIVRNGHEVSVNNKWYRLYVHIWCDFFPIRAIILMGANVARKVSKIIRRKYKNIKTGIS